MLSATSPGVYRTIDAEIVAYQSRKYVLLERTATSAHLYRKPPYRWSLAILSFLLIGIGLLIYSFIRALIAREQHVYITADESGVVREIKTYTTPRRRRQKVFLVLVPLVLIGLVITLVFAARQASAERHGVHICRSSDFNPTSGTCSFDDGQVGLGELGNAQLTIGSKDGSGFVDPTFVVNIARQTAAGGFAYAGHATLTGQGHMSGGEDSLGDVFRLASVPPLPGTYRFAASLASAGLPQTLGEATVTLTP